MSTDSTKTSSLRYFIIKYSFEFVVIIFGILISLLLEQNRQNNIEIDRKNNTVSQLINVIEEDINQINGFIYLQNFSLRSCDLILDNLKKKNAMTEDSIVYHLSSIGRALRSFFPQQGIFNQLVNSNLIKMINSDDMPPPRCPPAPSTPCHQNRTHRKRVPRVRAPDKKIIENHWVYRSTLLLRCTE